MAFKEFFNDLKSSRNLTIPQLAENLGTSYSFVAKLLNGKREPSRNFLIKLKKAYPEIDTNPFFLSQNAH